jgi:hypothetical protein
VVVIAAQAPSSVAQRVIAQLRASGIQRVHVLDENEKFADAPQLR